jgi:hypothetical protein
MKTFIILIWATLWLIDILSQFDVRLARSGHKKRASLSVQHIPFPGFGSVLQKN